MITVVPYNPEWKIQFEVLRVSLLAAVQELALTIEHVGSTSVPGLAAKPILDIDIVIRSRSDLPAVIQRLSTLGYVHRGDLGITDRESFYLSSTPPVRHNLYVCIEGAAALQNHLILREALLANPDLRDRYSHLKQDLAIKYPDSIDHYVDGKTEFIVKILESGPLNTEQLEAIRVANLLPSKKP